jgi:hypothetical protein
MNSPITLEQIQEWIKNKQFDKFYRNEEIQKKYDSEKKEAIKNLRGKLEEIKKRKRGNFRWILRKNDYPYYFEKNLEHWILWDTDTMYSEPWEILKKDWNNRKLRSFFNKKNKEWVVWWINPIQFRSVSDIPHVHLVRKAIKGGENE